MTKASEPLSIFVVTTAAPGQAQTLRAAQEKLVEETLLEPGCLRYELHQSLDDDHVLIFVESWASEELWRAHLEGAAIKRFQTSGAGGLIRQSALYRLNLVAGGSPA
jgi:quinol monooxygenase YgiN